MSWIEKRFKRKKGRQPRSFDEALAAMLNLINELLAKVCKENIPGPIVHGVLLFTVKASEEELAKLGAAREPAQAIIDMVVKTLSEPSEVAA